MRSNRKNENQTWKGEKKSNGGMLPCVEVEVVVVVAVFQWLEIGTDVLFSFSEVCVLYIFKFESTVGVHCDF